MSPLDPTGVAGGPEQATASEPKTSQGIQPGGLPPELAEALKGVQPEVAQVIRQHISDTNATFTRNQQALAEKVRVAAYFDKLREDPQFNEFVRAYDSGNWTDFHRQGLARLGHDPSPPLAQAPVPADNLTGHPSGPSEDSNGQGVTADQIRAIVREEMQGTQNALQQANDRITQVSTEAQVERFRASHADWRDYWPLIAAEMQATPGISLEKAYILAKEQHGSVAGEQSPASPGQVGDQQAGDGLGVLPGRSSSPPPATSASHTAVDTPPEFSKKLGTGLKEAFEYAKRATGVSLVS